MSASYPIAARFREARERAGLSPDEAAARMGIASPSLWDIECIPDELTMVYSPSEIRRFCDVLGINPRTLFGIELETGPISAAELARLVREHCLARNLSIEQFESAAGWDIARSLDDPEKSINEEYSINGVQDICRELGVDWQRFILGL